VTHVDPGDRVVCMQAPAPAERVRARLIEVAGAEAGRAMPSGYQRLGRVLLLRLPESLRPHFRTIGEAWCRELGVEAVLRYRAEVSGELRVPSVETIVGERTETEVREHGVRYRFDAAAVLFARGNRTERARIGRLVRPGETVVDLFAGIGYFALPAAVHGHARTVHAVELNPVSYRYLVENARLNGVEALVRPVLGDNRTVDLPMAGADRVLLGLLPSSLPWVGRAVDLLRPDGGTVHVHLVEGTRAGLPGAEARVLEQFGRAGATVESVATREVKPYGPGRRHVVIDARVRPPGRPRGATPAAPAP
jgi:tRNA wybutosine-synthesizing protein 2